MTLAVLSDVLRPLNATSSITHYDLQLFLHIEVMAENTYTDEDDEYNDSMERIVQLCNSMYLN